ncbi:hypothetical protein [Limosilactobacillus fastidiosus]|uniref:Uncharacterized protein n=1 Tax=Limosilactobacillus fastidiosus TaxID=2759855 RepID=A0ABR6E5Z9_9LACO|nr:hypothetical protein [Limosilactobacillus fastidiosus]MBB1062621.1 hypothetical protein [Limosilactobacillus fastidiosus]MCD7083976.1 hypothetical protein [Limosilactobacillus fastidiosus]
MTAAFKAVGLSILLTAFYLFPFIEQTFGNHLRASWTDFNFVQQPMQIINSSINDEPVQVVGFLLILTLLLGFIYLRKSAVLEKYSYFSGLVLVLLTTKLFPWGAILNTPLVNLQFPYRLNGLATIMFCIYLSFIVENIVIRLKKSYYVTTIVSLLVLITITNGLVITASHQIIE